MGFGALKSTAKITYLDGLRGLAALSVIFSHVFLWFNPYLHRGAVANQTAGEFSQWLFNSPFTFFYRGNAAVWLFFALSGFVLTYSLLKRKDSIESLRTAASKRYFRLGIPVFFSVLIGYLLMKLGVFQAKELGATASFNLAYTYGGDLWGMLKQAIWGSMLLGQGSYNYVLWTISIEFYGSMLVFAVIALFGGNVQVLRLVSVLMFCFFIVSFERLYSSMALFSVGMFLATFKIRERSGIGLVICSLVSLVIGLYLFGYHPGSDAYTYLVKFAGVYKAHIPSNLNWPVFYPQVGAIFVLLCVLISAKIFKILDYSFFQWLGKISFSLYLLHSFVVAILAPHVAQYYGGMVGALLCLAVTIPVTFAVSHVFYICVDKHFTDVVGRVFSIKGTAKESQVVASVV